MQKNKTAFISKSLSDVFYHIKTVNDIQLIAGCTQLKKIHDKSVSLRLIPELNTIDKKERYIEFGSAVSIAAVILSGGQKLPEILSKALKSIGTEQVRNIATLGGNICARDFKYTLWAPLLALNARLEIKSQNETTYIPFNKFNGLPEKQILSKIRIPLDEWEVEIFKRVGPSNTINDLSASFVFLADTQRGMIAKIRIAFAGKTIFYSPEFENRIIGTRLPLSIKTIDSLIDSAKKIYVEQNSSQDINLILKAQFLNMLRNSFEQLM
ncbi:FAD binding domain-containing protein [Treponema sp.]|uniref:FAD binding domain-containing protein n=1 Tax=Treponema sp. TaxID=166 RepID=UPI003EFFE5F9